MNKAELEFAVSNAIEALNKFASDGFLSDPSASAWKDRYMELKERYDALLAKLEDNLREAELHLETYASEGKTSYGAATTEGYVRCAQRVFDIAKSL